ncbi:MAG: bifunctional glutamate N-acetyltransferase/amino-acid acetyltransferase ArgJ [Pseudomonadota bacterium]
MQFATSPLAPDRFPDMPAIKGVRSATGSRGFYAPSGLDRDDVFLFALDQGTSCGGVFTVSQTASADVRWCRTALSNSGGAASALVVNSGNSNAFTGPNGVLKNDATLEAVVDALRVPKEHCYLAATGVIGEELPDPNYVGAVVPDLVAKLREPHWEAAARAFMTTDTFPKGTGAALWIEGHPVGVSGIAKGSGMIAPNMSTMLAYIFTDAAIAPDLLQKLTVKCADSSFNSVTVDGDTSTSDTFMIFATGASGAPLISTENCFGYREIEGALQAASLDLATQLVRDGEGATKFIEIEVGGADTERDAKTIAASIANSPLVKTALAAGDANWGRVVMAAGKAGVPFDQSLLDIWFGDHQVALGGGRAPGYSEAKASAVCASEEIQIRLRVGSGPASARVYTCDLTHAYIDINGTYRT